jgi:hypothetical protein
METKATLAQLVEELRKAVISAELARGRAERRRPPPYRRAR